MNTIEKDKLIAGFMNVDYITELNKLRDNSTNDEPLKMWHNDWNWLMEVVEKIESLGYYVKTIKTTCLILDVDEKCISLELNRLTKFEATYSTIVEFIKWYNEQNK
jgi:hypothetical protein